MAVQVNKTMKKKGVCRVCELVDNDKSLKVVYYCSLCDVWICEKCARRYDKRAIASIMHNLSKLLGGWNK